MIIPCKLLEVYMEGIGHRDRDGNGRVAFVQEAAFSGSNGGI
jgi:hypothetical protein